MNTNVKELAAWAADIAKKAGAQEARVVVSRSRDVTLARSAGALEQISESSTSQLSLELFVDGRYAVHQSADLRSKEVETFIRNAVTMTRYLQVDAHRKLPPPELYKGFQEQDLKLTDASYQTFTVDKREKLLADLEACLDSAKGKLALIESDVSDSFDEMAQVNTNGFAGYRSSNSYSFSVSLNAKDQGGSLSSAADWSFARQLSALRPVKDVADQALERVLAQLGSKPLKTQTLPVVVENRMSGRLLGPLLRGMGAGPIQQKSSFLEGKKGQLITAAGLTVTDDPFIPSGPASRLFDWEGIPTRKRVLIDKGIMVDYLVDVYYGSKLGWAPNGASTSNLTFALGSLDRDGLMKKVGKGMLVTGFLGGNSNPTTGDFSFGINGFYFENGKIVSPVKEMNVAGNFLELWKRLVETGNDPYLQSSIQSPSLLFQDMVISGV